MQKLYISREGLAKMKAELTVLNERRMKVAVAIEHARSLGDLSENAEYHSAKEEQALIHAKIKDLEDKVTRATLIDDLDIDTSRAYQGATVRVRNGKTGQEITYRLVSPPEADLAAGKISVQSPVGKALLGKGPGEAATAKVPAGDLTLEILEISY
ncbi:MAG TPA: transcription elongation factor GreA [Candidatus Hydrogenedentes bacterium]|nr:transcription elongation factor GreA [Candidatus Hydrogenedentota bacterium]